MDSFISGTGPLSVTNIVSGAGPLLAASVPVAMAFGFGPRLAKKVIGYVRSLAR